MMLTASIYFDFFAESVISSLRASPHNGHKLSLLLV